MSMPNIPDIDFDKQQGAGLIMASIGMQELGLSHIVNAEGEEIQSFLGTLDGQNVNTDINLEDLIALNKSVTDTLDSVANNEMLLFFKLNEVKKLLEIEEIETIDYIANKIWEGDTVEIRPDTVDILLFRNGTSYKTKTITDTTENGNTVTFYNLPKYDRNGNLYEYTIDEAELDTELPYNKSIDGNTITNSLID